MDETPVIMNWSYVAGFFDGEGHIHIGPLGVRRQIVLTIVQAQREDAVLAKVQQFLERKHIRTSLQYIPTRNAKWLPRNDLRICDYRSVRKVLRGMLKYLIVKRIRAVEALARIQERPYRRSETPLALLEKARHAYRVGLSFRQSALKYRIDAATLRRYMLNLGEHGRTVSESIRQWHHKMSPHKREALRRALRMGKHRQHSPRASRQIVRARSVIS